jgi:hypothetical protein
MPRFDAQACPKVSHQREEGQHPHWGGNVASPHARTLLFCIFWLRPKQLSTFAGVMVPVDYHRELWEYDSGLVESTNHTLLGGSDISFS